MDDTRIIDLYWQRSERAIAETDAKYGAYCRMVALNITGDTRDGEECVSDTWLAAWNSHAAGAPRTASVSASSPRLWYPCPPPFYII